MSKKIFLIRNVAHCNYGGAEKYQLMLANELARYNYESVIISGSKELIKGAKKQHTRTIAPPYKKRQNWSGPYNLLLPIYWTYQIRLYCFYKRLFIEERPEIVNIQSRDDMIAATLAAKRCGIRVFWTDHADFKNWVLWNVNKPWKNLIGKKIIKCSRYTEKVVFIGNSVKHETDKMIAPKKISHGIVIRNGAMDMRDTYRDTRVKYDFVYLGRLDEKKGIKDLLEAYKNVVRKKPETSMAIYGDGPLLCDVQDVAAKYPGIKVCGMTRDPFLALASGRVFVLPSYMEGLSLSLVEASMMGKAIIASDIKENREVISEADGLLFPAGSALKLSEAMEMYLRDDGLVNKMSKKARKRYEENFDFERIVREEIIPLYNEGKE